jgi:hypothetical protein
LPECVTHQFSPSLEFATHEEYNILRTKSPTDS